MSALDIIESVALPSAAKQPIAVVAVEALQALTKKEGRWLISELTNDLLIHKRTRNGRSKSECSDGARPLAILYIKVHC